MGALGRYRRRILKARGELVKRPRVRGPAWTERKTLRDHLLALSAIALFRKQQEPPTPGPDFAARKRG